MKKIKLIIFAIVLIVGFNPTNSYAVNEGGTCTVTGDCDYGLLCRRIYSTSPSQCVKGPGVGAACSGPDSCGKGFTCAQQAIGTPPVITYVCEGSVGAPTSIGEGVSIGQAFINNFSGGFVATPGEFVSSILGQIYIIALVLVLIYLVWGAYRYMLSGGDPKAVAAARQHLTWAVVGMIIIFLSYGMFQIVNSLINNIYN